MKSSIFEDIDIDQIVSKHLLLKMQLKIITPPLLFKTSQLQTLHV